MPTAPAVTVISVRTTGTNRASTTATGPYRAKNRRARAVRDGARPSSTVGPAQRPISYPATLPANAATTRVPTTSHSGWGTRPWLTSRPTDSSRVSPGKITPNSSPHSASTTAAATQSAHGPAAASSWSGARSSTCTRLGTPGDFVGRLA